LALIADPSWPAIVRATALDEVARFSSRDVVNAAITSLRDPAPVVRLAAMRPLTALPPAERAALLLPLCSDPVRSVRIEAATLVAALDPQLISSGHALAFERALGEAEAALILNADRPEGRAGRAQLLLQRGQIANAERELRVALAQMSDAAALAVNLADLYRMTGREVDGSALLMQFLAQNPDANAVRHALGLSLVRQKKHGDALLLFQQAHEAEPENGRYAFVYGVALQSAGQVEKGRAILEAALARDPWNVDLNNALLADALRSNDVQRAALYAQRLTALRPDDPSLARLSNVLNRK
jgi:tetratricopeptide (TPR) repeat protein